MTREGYINIILEGLYSHQEYLSEHFYREFKKAETNHIGAVEFFKRLNEATTYFVENIKRQYDERFNKVQIQNSLRNEKGEPTDDLKGQIPKLEDISVDLHSRNNMGLKKYILRIYISHIEIVKKAIEECNNKYCTKGIEVITKDFENKIASIEQNVTHYDFNYFNDVCYKLFMYLIEKYNKAEKVKYINIYYFLKGITTVEQDKYQFTIKIEDYKRLIKSDFQVDIKKFAKAKFSYEEKELPKLKNLRKEFEKSLK